ncbi:30S ribosomal protein S8 [Candidatus Roizmanbacteria bacterium]|nr:30S ribosomal protein S8 [Candidatus Roizmanbacteria bacterium]
MENSIIDFIIRIKNGYMARKETVDSPFSRFREEIAKKLVKLSFIKDYSIKEVKPRIKKMTIELLYKNGQPAITDVKIFSKLGQRYYTPYKRIKPVLGGLGFSLLSTSKGTLTNIEARKLRVGGELLFEIW